jgi:CheY-like chemotaxis protein
MKTVLVVDDEFDLAGTLRAILEGEGYAAEVCSNGREALDRLQTHQPDLVLMDVMMPRMSGYEVLKVMRQTPGLDAIPVVLMSSAPARVKPTDFKWDGFLRKPFTLGMIVQTINGLLGRTRGPATSG